MVAELLVDALWRSRSAYLVMGVMLVPLWLLFGESRANPLPISLTGLSLILAMMLGPMLGVPTMGLRALRQLPVTPRDLWRTTWVVATVVPAGMLLATKAISGLLVAAGGGTPTVSTEAMMLSAVYDFTWAGAVLPLLPVLVYAGPDAARPGTLAASVEFVLSIVGLLVCFGLPILVSGALPTDVSALTPATLAILIAGLAMAFGALVWTPRRGVLAGVRARPQRAVVHPAAASRLADRMTGISRVAIPQLLATFALAVGASLALATYGVLSGSDAWWFVPTTKDLFDPADVGDRGLTPYVLMPCAVVTMLAVWAPWARLLKVLPLSVTQINALLVLTSVATWAMLWILGLSLYWLAHGTPPTLRVDLAFGLAGISALSHAALLRFQGGVGVVWVTGVIGGLMPQIMKVGLTEPAARVPFAIVGAIALATAVIVNHRTLTRSTSSSRAYRRPLRLFGLPATPGSG